MNALWTLLAPGLAICAVGLMLAAETWRAPRRPPLLATTEKPDGR